jgi:hypothetical protein
MRLDIYNIKDPSEEDKKKLVDSIAAEGDFDEDEIDVEEACLSVVQDKITSAIKDLYPEADVRLYYSSPS